MTASATDISVQDIYALAKRLPKDEFDAAKKDSFVLADYHHCSHWSFLPRCLLKRLVANGLVSNPDEDAE